MLSLDTSLIVANLLPVSDPRDAVFAILLRVCKRLESIAKEGLLLDEVDDVDPNLLVLASVGDLEVEPLIVAPCVDVVLEDEVVSVYDVLLVIVLVDVHQVAALKVRVEDQRPIVFAQLSGVLALDLGEVVEPSLGLEVDSCDVHEQISKVMFFDLGLKARVVDISFPVDVPESVAAILFLFVEHLLHLVLHPPVFIHGVFDGDQPVAY